VSAARRPRLPRSFYTDTDVIAVARRLLGHALVVRARGGARVAGRIVETEAYRGPDDRASHAWGHRRTARNQAMYAIGGTAYVFFVYGMHHHVNVVTGPPDLPHAVLIRAVEPIEGVALMRRRRPGQPDRGLTSGPGKLCAALGIDRALDGADLLGDRMWIEPAPRSAAPPRIAAGTRIGIDYAGAWARRRWRFWIAGNPFVSRPAPRPRVRRAGGPAGSRSAPSSRGT